MKFPFVSRDRYDEMKALKDERIAELKEQCDQLAELCTVKRVAEVEEREPAPVDKTVLRVGPTDIDADPVIPLSSMRRGSIFNRQVSARNTRDYNQGRMRSAASDLFDETARQAREAARKAHEAVKNEATA